MDLLILAAAEASKSGPSWIQTAAAGVFTAVVAGVVAAGIGYRFKRKENREVWQRDQLHESGATFLAKVDEVETGLRKQHRMARAFLQDTFEEGQHVDGRVLTEFEKAVDEQIAELRRASSRVGLVGSKELRGELGSLLRAVLSIDSGLEIVGWGEPGEIPDLELSDDEQVTQGFEKISDLAASVAERIRHELHLD